MNAERKNYMQMKTKTILILILFCTGPAILAQNKLDIENCNFAYSADGFNQDRDDIAGSAMAVALFDRAGMADRIVHFHFNTNFGGKPTHAREHRRSVLQTAVLFAMIEEENGDDAFFDVSRSPEEKETAIAHLATQMANASKEEPLIMICAGGVQVVGLASM